MDLHRRHLFVSADQRRRGKKRGQCTHGIRDVDPGCQGFMGRLKICLTIIQLASYDALGHHATKGNKPQHLMRLQHKSSGGHLFFRWSRVSGAMFHFRSSPFSPHSIRWVIMIFGGNNAVSAFCSCSNCLNKASSCPKPCAKDRKNNNTTIACFICSGKYPQIGSGQ